MDRARFKRFFECAGKIMESQLLYAFKKSLKDFMDMVVRCQVNYFQTVAERR